MLSEIRDRSSGWFAWAIAIMIIIPMAFWGVQEYASSGAAAAVATVGEQKITKPQFDSQLNTEQQMQRMRMGENVNEEILNSNFFKQNVLDRMINRALIENVAVEQNYRIGDQQLAELIKANEVFQNEGGFDVEAYDRYVQSSRYSKTQFENELREDQRVTQVVAGYEESAMVLPGDVRQLLEMQSEKREIDIVSLGLSDQIAATEVTDEEIEAHYASAPDAYLKPEQMQLSYVELDIENIKLDIDINEEILRDRYEQNLESFQSEETRRMRHILLTTSDDNDEAQREKAEDLVAQLRSGADFAELAKQHSDDTATATNGGDLDEVERGQMVEEFEQAGFSLQVGAISEPVKSQFGYHIIRVDEIIESAQQSFDDVRADLEAEELQAKAEEKVLEQLEEMQEFAFSQPENLDGVANALSATIQQTDWFESTNGSGIAANPQVRIAAFSDPILYSEENSEPIEIGEGRYVVVRKLEHRPAEPLPLADVSARIKTQLANEKARAALTERGELVLTKAQADWDEMLTNESLEAAKHEVTLIDNTRVVPTDVVREVSAMHLKSGESSINLFQSASGDVHLIRLNRITPGDASAVSEQVKDSARRLVQRRNGQALAQTYIAQLRQHYEVEVNQQLIATGENQ